MKDSTADVLMGGPKVGNDFDADMYELRKTVAGIFAALENATAAGRFGFIGNELADTSQLIDATDVEALEFTLPCPKWEEL